MDHSDVQENLEHYIKRQLEPDVFNEVADHLTACQVCTVEHDTLQNYFVALENLESQPAPANFLGSVYKRIQTKTTWENS